ncbi:MAG: polysaccharide lyase [Bacteroidales bacterium]
MNIMKYKLFFLSGLFIYQTFTLILNAQYPKVPKEVQATADSMMMEAQRLSDIAWEKALPIIHDEAKNGKPYIPWAARPTDLPQADIPAFPGAEGGGMYAFGGRGGRVIVVTSLEDRGNGSLRAACEQGGARIVVFNVAGIIRLKSPLIIRAPYITIAGQTAPGDGICVAGETVWINTHDVVIRHMRFRRGETWVGRRDDAIGGNPVGNIMIDHVSASWGLDENMSIYRHMFDDGTGKPAKKLGTVNITIQNSIFSEALDTYNHSFGSTLGGENCNFHRNLWANNAGRNPSIGWNGIFNFTNNIVYNWWHRSLDGGDYTALYNIFNNYYKPGPVTPKDKSVGHRILKPETGRSQLGRLVFGRAYVNGNIMEGYPEITRDNWAGGVQIEDLPDAGDYTANLKWNKPFPMAPVTILSAQEAYNYVLSNAGATLPKRDRVDQRIIRQVSTNQIDLSLYKIIDTLYQFEHRRLQKDSYKYGIITDIAQVGGYPEYKGKPYKDSDMDGMPDEWEKKYGLDPKNPADANGDISGDGYSNIEKYINGINPGSKVDWSNLGNNKDTLSERGGIE